MSASGDPPPCHFLPEAYCAPRLDPATLKSLLNYRHREAIAKPSGAQVNFIKRGSEGYSGCLMVSGATTRYRTQL
jgi:hypothetical protein